MATTIRPQEKLPQVFIDAAASLSLRQALRQVRGGVWLVLLAALIGFTVFAYQVTLVPQPRDYHPNWHGAAWIAAPGSSGVAYYRKTFALSSIPANAYLLAQSDQDYSLYVNGQPVDGTRNDIDGGATNLAYIYDVTPRLRTGLNVIAFRVENRDDGVAALRAVIGINSSAGLQVYPTGSSWKSTSDPQLAHPQQAIQNLDWRSVKLFDAAWQQAAYFTGTPPSSSVLQADQALYEVPPAPWISAGAATDAFYYHTVTLPVGEDMWVRAAATGGAQIFINGRLVISQVPRIAGNDANPVPSSAQVTTGLYDVSPYLHAGPNALAVHVSGVGLPLASGTMQNQPAALSLDLITDTGVPLDTTNSAWHVSPRAVDGWITGSGTGNWAPALVADSASFGVTTSYELPASANEQIDFGVASGVILTTALLFALGCLCALALLGVRRGTYAKLPAAIQQVALALVPTLLLQALLLVIAWEPLVARPFPFTAAWLATLIALALLTFVIVTYAPRLPWRVAFHRASRDRAELATRLAVGVLTFVGFLLAVFQLDYESYWQDEATSVYAAHGILQNGIPHLLSGFIYPKAELYSYTLAFVMAFFGDQASVLRLVSVVEYVASLIITYLVGRRFFNRQIGVLALALLVCSPMALRWGREARMYQQAELFTLLALYVFFRAVQPHARPRTIFWAMALVVAMYLSHEETFIILPALVIYLLAVRGLSWLRDRNWLIAGCCAVGIVALQLLIVKVSHPPLLGTDHSQQPLLTLSTENITYYAQLLFNTRVLSHGALATLTVTSILTSVALISALIVRDPALRYLSAVFGVAVVILIFLFSPTADRYIYPLLPVMAILAASAFVRWMEWLAALARAQFSRVLAQGLSVTCGCLLFGAVFFSQVTPVANFGLATSRLTGLPYHHHYPVYADAGAYIRANWQPGDVLVTLAPAIDGAYYAHQPNYLIYQTKALYLFEQNGHIVDTPTGSTVLLNEQDVNEMIAQHHRIWVLAADSYLCCASVNSFPVNQYFALVYENAGTYVYFRTG